MTTLQLPILGNPHGRIFQTLQLGEDAREVLRNLLQRYGDLVPKSGTVDFHQPGAVFEITYMQAESGRWLISDPQVKAA